MVCVTPNVTLGVTVGAMAIGAWFTFAGFLIPRPVIPEYYRWVWYLVRGPLLHCALEQLLGAIGYVHLHDIESLLHGSVQAVCHQLTFLLPAVAL